jgi:ABC-type dipeptide/oligopeptide/nickel transport system permease subunit
MSPGEAVETGSALGRTVIGAAITLPMVAAALILTVAIGIGLGALAGSGSQLAQAVLARLAELSSALPPLLIVGLLHAARLVPAAAGVAVVLGVARGIELARLVRGEMLRVGSEDFVTAARALGVGRLRLLRRHMLPHALGPVLASASLTAAATVALDAALGLFGLGSSASWGGQIAAGLTRGALPDVVWPSLAALVTSGAFFAAAEAASEAACERRRGAP